MADDTLTLTLEKPVAGGRTLARHAGRVVLVSGGIPGERVRVAMERSGKGVAFARVESVEEPSPDRITPEGDPRCGGLAFAHVAYPRQVELKRAIVEDAMARIGRLRDLPAIETVGSPVRAWRLRARLHVQGGRAGFFREGSHALCNPRPSGQMVEGLVELAEDTVRRLAPQAQRAVDAVVVTSTVAGDQQAVHLELTRPLPRHGDILAPPGETSAGGAPQCTGVSAALTSSRQTATLWGHPWVSESLSALGLPGGDAATLVRHAAAFFQGNRALLPGLVRHVLDAVRDDAPIVDLYAGVGLFGIAAAVRGASSVTLVEGDPVSAEDLVTNAAAFGDRVRAVRGDVESFVGDESAALSNSSVVVDPPRTGLSPVVTKTLAASPPRRLVYVSCDPATLARDLQALTGAGMRITSMTMFDMFPVTAHVETVVVLER